MDVLPRDVLQTLLSYSKTPCVSIYMPTVHVESQVKQNPTRFKNLLSLAHKQLVEHGIRSAEAQAMLAPARELIEDLSFWRNQSEGLAAYISQDWFRIYRFPYAFEELCMVNDRFHVKELLPLMSDDGRFYLLALSQNSVRLLRGTHYNMGEIRLDNVPESLAEALRYDEGERQLQWHTETSQAPGGQKRPAMYFGQSYGGDRNEKTDILRYFQQIDRGLHEFLRDEKVPLILAGVEYLFPIYRDANTYPHLLDEGLPGNPEHTSNGELHERAWELVKPTFQQRKTDEVARYKKLAGKGQLSSSDPKKIVSAAYFKQVDSLFLPIGQQMWGQFNPDTNKVEIHEERQPTDEDLFDLAATYSYMNGGTVFTVEPEEMPNGSPLAAILRY